MERRKFVKDSMLATAGFSIIPNMRLNADDKRARVALIGTGLRGQDHLDNLLRRNDADLIAICDVDDRMLQMAGDRIKKSGKPMPQVFKGDPPAYRKLLELKNIDAVIIATPWEWHTPMILDSLQAGIKYVGTEVVLGITLDDHWKVVH